MIKLFVDGHVFDGEYQGSLTYLKELYHHVLIQNSGISLTFGVEDENKINVYFNEFCNVKYVKYKSKSKFRRYLFEIPKIIDDLNCNYAHFQYHIPLKKNKNCKYIATIHDILFVDFPKDWSFNFRFSWNLLYYINSKRYDYILTVSEYSKKKIANRFGINKNKIILTPNAVSSDFYNFNFSKNKSKKFIQENYGLKKYILYVSRIESRKNQVKLLNIFKKNKLINQNYDLVFIGNNTFGNDYFKNELQGLDSNLKKSVKWLYNVNSLSLLHFYNGAEVFVFPSRAEGFGIPPLEAATLLTPVLCSSKTAMADFSFFEPFMFDPDDLIEFEVSLLKILESKKNIDLVSIKNQILNQYSWHHSANKLLEIIT